MGRILDGLITWSIRQRVIVLIGAAVLVVLGLWSALHARTDVLPEFTPPRVVIQTEALGMPAADVEDLITRPLEKVLLGTPESTAVRSTSSPGLSVITVLFVDGLDIYRARQLVTERVDIARSRLPQTAKPPQLAPISAPIGAILKFAITGASAGTEKGDRELRTFAEWTLRPRLLAVPGVSQVTVLGGGVERIEVRPDLSRMKAVGVSITEIADAVTASQSLVGGGFVEVGEQRLDVQNDARLPWDGAEKLLADAPLARPSGPPLRLRDVAETVRAEEPRVGGALYDGRRAVFVQVNKLPSADTLKVTSDVEAALEEVTAQLPEGARIEPAVFRQASFIRTSIMSVGRAMAIGAVLVVVVLLIFLRIGRLALISMVAIPLSVLTALAVLVAFGMTVNGMVLGGLTIAVGEVVDDAIVDVENVWRRLRENATLPEPRAPLDVIHDASREVRGSVVYATVIVCVVLVPVLTLGGIAGRIFSPLAQAYILAILASLVVALTVTPALCAVLLPKIVIGRTEETRFARGVTDRYRGLLRWAIRWPRAILLPSAAATVIAVAVIPFLGGRFLPEFHERALVAHVHAAPGTSLDQTLVLGREVDARLRPDLASHVAIRAGRAELDEDAAPVHRMEIDLVLKDLGGREWDAFGAEVAKRIGSVPGLGFVVEGFLGERIHEILSGETAPVVVKVVGPDLDQLRRLASEIARHMETVAGLGHVQVEPQINVPQLRIRPNRASLARYGVSPLTLTNSVLAWRQGKAWSQVLGKDGRLMDVVMAGAPATRDVSFLKSIPVATANGQLVPLAELADVEQVAAPSVVQHEGGERRIVIGASARGAALSLAASKLDRLIKQKVSLPAGYRVEIGGEATARTEAGGRLLLIGGLVLLGIFVFLASAFSSIRDAGIVLLNIPLGLVGGVVAAVFTPEGLSVSGFVGFVTLFGIISRNGIMLVSHKRDIDAHHPEQDPIDRVLRAAEERVLPILMTAATAFLGLLPLAVSFEAAGSELEAPMALIVCGGLVTSTALNLVVLPTFYVWLARRSAARSSAMIAA